MYQTLRKTLAHPLLAIGSTVLWGIIELVALNRPSRAGKGR